MSNTLPGIQQQWPGRPGRQIYRWLFDQPASDTEMMCRFLLLPGVSALLPVSYPTSKGFLKLLNDFLMQ